MKNRFNWLFWVLAIITTTLGVLGASAQNIRRDVADYHYDGALKIDAETGYIQANWEISFLDPNAENARFLLRGTLGDLEIIGEDLAGHSIVSDAEWQGFHVVEVKLHEADKHKPRKIRMTYEGVLFPTPPEEDYNAITPDRVDLHLEGFWFPMDIGFNKNLTANITIDAGTGWTPVSTDKLIYGGDILKLSKTYPFLDISFSLLKNAHVIQHDGYTIFDLRKNSNGIASVVEVADYCIKFLNQNFGAQRPLPHSAIMINEREKGGFARRNYISLANVDNYDRKRLMAFVCHEFSHYWSSDASVGSADSWLNEGFATFVETMALREAFGEDVFNQRVAKYEKQVADWIEAHNNEGRPTSVWSADDQSRRPHILSYRKAFLMLVKLEKKMGREAFLKFVQAYMDQQVRTTPQLLEILENIADQDTATWFQTLLSS